MLPVTRECVLVLFTQCFKGIREHLRVYFASLRQKQGLSVNALSKIIEFTTKTLNWENWDKFPFQPVPKTIETQIGTMLLRLTMRRTLFVQKYLLLCVLFGARFNTLTSIWMSIIINNILISQAVLFRTVRVFYVGVSCLTSTLCETPIDSGIAATRQASHNSMLT